MWYLPLEVEVPFASGVIILSVLLVSYFVTHGQRSPRRPPVVRYWIPWLGSAMEMAKDPDKLFKSARERYGDIFAIQTAGRRYYYVTSNTAYEPFLVFDGHFPLMAADMPRFMVSKAFKARDVLLDLLQVYLANPDWTLEASELTKEMHKGCQSANFSPRDTAAMLSTDLWGAESSMTWAFVWVFNLTLHRPGALAPLVDEVNSTLASWKADNPNADISNPDDLLAFLMDNTFPLIASHVTESLRLCTSTFSIRTVEEDDVVVGGYEFKRGDMVVCTSPTLHLDESVYPDPHTFKGDRFLGMNVPESGGKGHYRPFGGGVSQCQGRHFASRGIKPLLALFLLHFDIELDRSIPSEVDYDRARTGLGVLHPSKPTHIVVRKRNLF
ncbi:Cholesterol 7-alpha-monooxygenase [Tulasnella sp. 403]|nr:Cholesterol 7-alpha-monooxygenase [Tulasnella sp. 403]